MFFSPQMTKLLAESQASIPVTPAERERLRISEAGYSHVHDLPFQDVVHVDVPLDAPRAYQLLMPSHLQIVAGLAHQLRRTSYYRSHSPAAVRYTGQVLGESLPDPMY